MKQSRRSRHITALWVLFSVLFMQLAVAAYACPGISTGKTPAAQMTASAAHHDMEGCEGMSDADLPTLCFAQSQDGTQSLDKPALPDLSQPVPVILVPAIGATDIFRLPDYSRDRDAGTIRYSPSSSLAIQHCCFRI